MVTRRRVLSSLGLAAVVSAQRRGGAGPAIPPDSAIAQLKSRRVGSFADYGGGAQGADGTGAGADAREQDRRDCADRWDVARIFRGDPVGIE